MSRLGVAFWGGMQATDIVEAARLAEKGGFESVWMAEGHGGDAFSILTACAMATKKIKLGTSIVSVFVRSAPTIAIATGTLDCISNKRFRLGLGSSHKVQVDHEHGITYENPMQRIRETVEVVRTLLEEEKIAYAGQTFNIRNYDLWFQPVRGRVPIYLSAVFPKMLELCGEIADGAILVWSSADYVKKAVESIRIGANRANRSIEEIDIACLLPTCVSKNSQTAKMGMKSLIAFYCGFFPRYNRLMSECGFPDEAAAIRNAWKSSEKTRALNLVSEEMVDTLAVAGTQKECERRIKQYRVAGVALPIIFPTSAKPPVKPGVIEAVKAFSK
ncbi:MAG: LLM class flavin-dependent oxidoreductase [Candidatus Bathyarchaeia archaeon]